MWKAAHQSAGLGEGAAVGEVVFSGQPVEELRRQQLQQLWDSRVEGLSIDLTAVTDEDAAHTPYGTKGLLHS